MARTLRTCIFDLEEHFSKLEIKSFEQFVYHDAPKRLKELGEKYPALLNERYGIQAGTEPLEMMNAICVRRGFLLKGGEFDYERLSAAVIDDFRKGRIGKIFLD